MNNNTKDDIQNHPILSKDWYHSIEIQPGVFTPGRDHKNISLTRELLKGIEIEEMNCLDIGAMDGLISLLLKRRNAAQVTAHERVDFSDRINFIKEIFDVDFNYFKGISLNEIKEVSSDNGLFPFDVVIFSGVLYHMFDPFSGLAFVRGLTRNGGIMLIETSAAFTYKDECMMFFNNAGRFFPGTNYWQISVSCLDYLLRFLNFEILDLRYFKNMKFKEGHQGRVAIVCRAVEQPIPAKGDDWMPKTDKFTRDFREFIDWDKIRVNNSKKVNYAYPDEKLKRKFHNGTNSVNVYETIKKTPETIITDIDRQIKLKISDIY